MPKPVGKPARTRFAPSPTGLLHLGSLRTAIFKYLYARHTGGTFILRIDDTDRARLVAGAEEQIRSSLSELELDWDEGPGVGGPYGPYRQSERLDLYRQYARQLTDSGALYPCWCDSQRLDDLRARAQKQGIAFKYDRHCLQPENQKPAAEPHVLRFRIPDNGKITWYDAVKGRLSFEVAEMDDFVAVKSDGWPTYHFSSVVDDHTMRISHVVRGDEWVASTPKHLLTYRAFGWQPPVYAHVPAILGPDGKKKLSKRDGVKSAAEYVREGYLPEALVNFLALLGWHEGEGVTQEIYSREELINKFSLERIQKSPAKFDPRRLEWMNGVYIRQMPLPELLRRAEGFWPAAAKKADSSYKAAVLGLVQERLKYLSELPELTDFFFTDPVISAGRPAKGEESGELLLSAAGALKDSDFSHADLEDRLRRLAREQGLKSGQLFGLIRLAVTGKTASPGLFETLHVLGKAASLRRLEAAARLA